MIPGSLAKGANIGCSMAVSTRPGAMEKMWRLGYSRNFGEPHNPERERRRKERRGKKDEPGQGIPSSVHSATLSMASLLAI